MEVRAEAASLSRNVKISTPDPDDAFGCRVVVSTASRDARVVIVGAEISNCRQDAPETAALEIRGGSGARVGRSAIPIITVHRIMAITPQALWNERATCTNVVGPFEVSSAIRPKKSRTLREPKRMTLALARARQETYSHKYCQLPKGPDLALRNQLLDDDSCRSVVRGASAAGISILGAAGVELADNVVFNVTGAGILAEDADSIRQDHQLTD